MPMPTEIHISNVENLELLSCCNSWLQYLLELEVVVLYPNLMTPGFFLQNVAGDLFPQWCKNK